MKVKFLFIIFFLCSFASLTGQDIPSDPGRENYLAIRRYYNKWDQGFDGSRGYFKKVLYSFLVEMIGRDITTDYDFIPEDSGSVTHRSRFRAGKWLVVSGMIAEENYKEIVDFRKKYGKNSQPGKGLFSISGRIKKFRLSDYSGKREIYLYLDNMRLENSWIKK